MLGFVCHIDTITIISLPECLQNNINVADKKVGMPTQGDSGPVSPTFAAVQQLRFMA